MNAMDLRELRDALNELTDEQLNIPAAVFIESADESYSVAECRLLSEMPKTVRERLYDVYDTDQPLIVCGDLDRYNG